MQSLNRVSDACFDNLDRRSLPFTRRGKGVKHNLVKCNFPREVIAKSEGMTVPGGRKCQCGIFKENS